MLVWWLSTRHTIAHERNVGQLLEILTATHGSNPDSRSHGNERVIAGLLLAVDRALAGTPPREACSLAPRSR